MAAVSAWLIDFEGGARAAVGELDLVHVLPDPPVEFEVPGRPAHCRRVLLWEDQLVPVFDVGVYLGTARGPGAGPPHHAIVRYRPRTDGRPDMGALSMARIPFKSMVDDASACELPATMCRWRPIASACFLDQQRPVPVIDIGRMFRAPLTAAA